VRRVIGTAPQLVSADGALSGYEPADLRRLTTSSREPAFALTSLGPLVRDIQRHDPRLDRRVDAPPTGPPSTNRR
jgi:hypothetical protein